MNDKQREKKTKYPHRQPHIQSERQKNLLVVGIGSFIAQFSNLIPISGEHATLAQDAMALGVEPVLVKPVQGLSDGH